MANLAWSCNLIKLNFRLPYFIKILRRLRHWSSLSYRLESFFHFKLLDTRLQMYLQTCFTIFTTTNIAKQGPWPLNSCLFIYLFGRISIDSFLILLKFGAWESNIVCGHACLTNEISELVDVFYWLFGWFNFTSA